MPNRKDIINLRRQRNAPESANDVQCPDCGAWVGRKALSRHQNTVAHRWLVAPGRTDADLELALG